MNFATPAVVLLLLGLPGVIFRRAYLRGVWQSHPFRRGNIGEEIAISAALTVGIHVVGLWLVDAVGYRVDFKLALSLVYGPGPGNAQFDSALLATSAALPLILIYLALANAGAWFAGYGLHRFVRFGRLDLQTRTFRFDHPWHYLFSGEILDFNCPNGPFPSNAYDLVLIAALIEQGDDIFLYRGPLREVHYDQEGELNRLVLEFPQRARLPAVEDEEVKGDEANLDGLFRPIDGRFFVLFTADIKNINVQYVALAD